MRSIWTQKDRMQNTFKGRVGDSFIHSIIHMFNIYCEKEVIVKTGRKNIFLKLVFHAVEI